MRQHNKYLLKVAEELSIYQQYLIDDSTELTPTQREVYEKIETVRERLRDGQSDAQVLISLKQTYSLQERRCREILALAYEVFAELRSNRNKNGVKYVYSEIFRRAAEKAENAGDFKSAGVMYDKAARIDGAYDKQEDADNSDRKKPTKVIIKAKKLVVNNGPAADGEGGQTIQIEGHVEGGGR